ncbi:MAG: ABC-2 transporter permease [Eggerthellaceae bacterium]|jgi:uncharacterized membrane protein|nr:ABC-2 transporter permease [Eggerthellaceae bacterium]MCH4221483.1 ABC-2 transporter permease [Eggerthellaceae bacterium]
MKIMIKNDLACIKDVLLTALLSGLFVAIILCLSLGNVAIVVPVVTIAVTSALILRVLAVDEHRDWKHCCENFEVTVKQIVVARYLTCLILLAFSLIVSVLMAAICTGVCALLTNVGIGGTFVGKIVGSVQDPTLLPSALCGCALTLVMIACVMPLAFKQGLSAPVRVLPVIFSLLVLLYVIFSQGIMAMGVQTSTFTYWMQKQSGAEMITFVIAIVSLLVYVISCTALSRRLAH